MKYPKSPYSAQGAGYEIGAYEYIGGTQSISTPTTQPPVPGDANNDDKVDIADYVIWLNNYNQQKQGSQHGNFDNNRVVDGVDFVI